MLQSIVVTIVTGVVTALIAGAVGRLIYERYEKRRQYTQAAQVRRLTRPDDPDVPAYIELYRSLFPENETASAEDMVRWLAEYQRERKNRHHTLDEYYLLAKVAGHVIGIANLQYYQNSRYLFISYMGIDKRSRTAREVAASSLITHIRRLLQTELRHCKGLVYETDRPNPSGEQPNQNRRRAARMQLFRGYARQFGFRAYELLIGYVAPILDLDDNTIGYAEEELALNFVPLRGQVIELHIARTEVVSILRFIYMQVYGDSHKDDATKDAEYRQYLAGMLDRAVAALPDPVKVR